MAHFTSFKHRTGSQPGKLANTDSDFEGAMPPLENDYFSASAKYIEKEFEHRFRMLRKVFYRLVSSIIGKGILVV